MLKKTLLLSLTLLINGVCLAQADLPLPYSDFKMFDGYDRVEIREFAIDQENNLYMVPSYFTGGLYEMDSLLVDSNRTLDFNSIIKYDSKGHRIWLKSFFQIGEYYPFIRDIIDHTDTSVLISVDAMGTLIIDQDTLQFPSFSEVRRFGLLLELHKEDGRLLNYSQIVGNSISLLELTKSHDHTILFFPSTIKYFLSNEDTVFLNMSTNAVYPLPLANYDFVGDSMKWLKIIPTRAASINDIEVVPSSGDIAVGGFFKSWIVFDQDTLHAADFHENYFVALYDKHGTFKWAKSYDSGDPTLIKYLAVSEDQIICSGNFANQLTFDSFSLQVGGPNGYFLASLDMSGNTQWLQRSGEFIDDIAITESSIYSIGRVENGSQLNGITVYDLLPGNLNISLVRRDLDGELHWFGIHPGDYSANTNEFVISNNSQIHIGGAFNQDFPFMDSTFFCRGPRGGFLMSLKDSLVTGLEPNKVDHSYNFQLAPNPSRGLFKLSGLGEATIEACSVLDMAGRPIMKQKFEQATKTVSIDLSRYQNGIYLLYWETNRETQTRKLIKTQ